MQSRQRRWVFAAIVILLLMITCVASVLLFGLNANDNLDVRTQDLASSIAVDRTATASPTPLPTETSQAVRTQVSERATATESAGAQSLTQAALPTLSTEQFRTAVANLATAQTSPTAEPTLATSTNRNIVGNADIRSYYNTTLAYPNTMRVTMELVFRELAIQPTPLDALDIIDINTEIDDPDIVPPDTQETPPPARLNERVNSVPLFVIAELDCLNTSFIGCEQKRFTHLNLRGINAWHWTIQPIDGISGNQNLSMRLFGADASGNMLSTSPIWEHNFTINVTDNWLLNIIENNLGMMILALSIIVLGAVGFFIFARNQRKVKPLGVSAFISYKRRGSWGIAEKIHDGLTSRGVDTFIDSQDLHEGDFEARLKAEIEKRDYVVVVLVPETLQSAWVVKEIAYGFELGKTIIPVLIEGVNMDQLEIPPEIADLRKQNGVHLYQKYFNAAIDEILVFLKPTD